MLLNNVGRNIQLSMVVDVLPAHISDVYAIVILTISRWKLL